MNQLKILQYPHAQLRKKTSPAAFTEELGSTIKQLFNTLYAVNGWALASTQVGLSSSILVMDISEEKNQPLCFINPEIVSKSGQIISEEDCLSFPGMIIQIPRAYQIQLNYQDENASTQSTTFDGIMSCCLQQGIDLLNGVLFIDHLSNLKRTRALAKYQKMKRAHQGCDHHHHHHGCDEHHH